MERLKDKTIVNYIRVSSDSSDENRQKTEIDQFLKKYKFKSITTFVDKDSSQGSKRDNLEDRKGWKSFIEYAKNKSNVVVVVQEPDRLWAGRHVVTEILNQHEKHNFEIMAVKKTSKSPQPIFLTDKEHERFCYNSGFDNEDYQDITSQKIIEAKSLGHNQGRYNGGRIAFYNDVVWYKCQMNGTSLVTDENNRLIKEYCVARIQKIGRVEFNVILYNEKGEMVETKSLKKMPHLRDEKEGIVPFIEPTTIQERLDAINQLFVWMDTEYIRASELARRLNTMRINSAGKGWTAARIKTLMQASHIESSALGLIGLPIIGKLGIHPRHEYNEDNVLNYIPRDERYKKKTRKMSVNHRRQPESPIYDPIVPLDLFNRVQDKIDKLWTRRNLPPLKHHNVLKDLIYHHTCDKPMFMGRNSKKGGKSYPFYSCSTHNKGLLYHHETKCVRSCISLKSLQYVIDDYFNYAENIIGQFPTEDTRIKISSNLINDLKQKTGSYEGVRTQIWRIMKQKMPCRATHQVVDGKLEEIHYDDSDLGEEITLCEAYDMIREAERKELDQKLIELQLQHKKEDIVYRSKVLDGLDATETIQNLKDIEARIKQVEYDKEINLCATAENMLSEIKDLKKQINDYEMSIKLLESSKSREHLERVVKKIVVRDNGKSVESIEIIPTSGELENKVYSIEFIKKHRCEEARERRYNFLERNK